MNFHLSCDSCVDQLKSNLKKNNISYLPMVFINNEQEHYDNFDTIEAYKSFYDEVRLGTLYTTSGVNETVASEYFSEVLNIAKSDVIHICLSSGLSITYDSCKAAADKINLTSEHKVYVIDSTSATQGQNLLLIIAQQLRDDGFTVAEAVDFINNIKLRLHHWFFIADLFHLKRGGRISGVAATIGSMLQMKPVITMSKSGKLEINEKVLGTKKAMVTLLNKIIKYRDSEMTYPIMIPHSDCPDLANELKQMILNVIPDANIIVNYIGPVVGSHTGPEALGVVFVGAEERIK